MSRGLKQIVFGNSIKGALSSLVDRLRGDRPKPTVQPERAVDDTLAQYERDLAWMFPPSDTSDGTAWDNYWQDQVEHRLAPPLFDMFCHDEQLVEAMQSLVFGRSSVSEAESPRSPKR